MVFGPLGEWFLLFDYNGNGGRAAFPMADGPGNQRRPILGHEVGAWSEKTRSLIPESSRGQVLAQTS